MTDSYAENDKMKRKGALDIQNLECWYTKELFEKVSLESKMENRTRR